MTRDVQIDERLMGIAQVLNVRLGEAHAALSFIDSYVEQEPTESLRVYRLARSLELKLSVAALERKVDLIARFIVDPEGTTRGGEVLNLDDFR